MKMVRCFLGPYEGGITCHTPSIEKRNSVFFWGGGGKILKLDVIFVALSPSSGAYKNKWQHLEDHPRTRKWLITMVIVSPLRIVSNVGPLPSHRDFSTKLVGGFNPFEKY